MSKYLKLGITVLIVVFASLGIGRAGAETQKLATFGGGNFWCMEPPFEKMEGVLEVITGYTGGSENNPTYTQVSSGATSHVMAVQVSFNPEEVSYDELLEVYWRQIDPTDADGQFVDRGKQYRTAIFFHNSTQERMARESRMRFASAGVFNAPIVTEIRPAGEFHKAVSDLQDFYKKYEDQYRSYRQKSGRDDYLKRIWNRVELHFD